jgi:hypothetical protein
MSRVLKAWEGTMYRVKGYAGHKHPTAGYGVLLLETHHSSESSKDVEVIVWRERIRRGEASKVEIIRTLPPYDVEMITTAA